MSGVPQRAGKLMAPAESKYTNRSVDPWTTHELFVGSNPMATSRYVLDIFSTLRLLPYIIFWWDSRLAHRPCVGTVSHSRQDD